MYEFIFYSIPGFLFVGSIFLWYGFALNDVSAVLAAVATPLLGYIFHNIYRFFFEISGNYSRSTRKVIDFLITKYGFLQPGLNREQAFLIWEHSIYHKDTSIPFLEHDGRMWRFIQSFWCVTLVASLLTTYFIAETASAQKALSSSQLVMLLALISVSAIFYVRGRNILKSLNDQEIAFVKIYKTELFDRVAKKLYPKTKRKQSATKKAGN